MKKIIAFGLLIAGFAVVSQAQTAGQTAENTPAIEVAQVAPASAVAPTKACCKKEGSAASASVSAPATVAPKAACSGASAEHKCGGHGDAAASASANASAPISAPGVAPKKACASGAEGKPCCKK